MNCTDVGAVKVRLGSSFVVLPLTPPQCCNSRNTLQSSDTTIWAPVGASPISISSPDACVGVLKAATTSDTSPTAGPEITAPSNLFMVDVTSLAPVLEAVMAGDVDPAADTQIDPSYNPLLVDATSLGPVPEADVAADVAPITEPEITVPLASTNIIPNSRLVNASSLAPATAVMDDDSQAGFIQDPTPTSPWAGYTPLSPVTDRVFPLEVASNHFSEDGGFTAIVVRCFIPVVPQLD